jgi:hypothetical protein
MFFHKELTKEKWQSLSFFEQMANVGAEIGRAINWREKDMAMSTASLYRGIELLDETIQDKKNKAKIIELCRLREVLADYFCFDNIYGSSDQNLNNYFYAFNYAARLNYGK